MPPGRPLTDLWELHHVPGHAPGRPQSPSPQSPASRTLSPGPAPLGSFHSATPWPEPRSSRAQAASPACPRGGHEVPTARARSPDSPGCPKSSGRSSAGTSRPRSHASPSRPQVPAGGTGYRHFPTAAAGRTGAAQTVTRPGFALARTRPDPAPPPPPRRDPGAPSWCPGLRFPGGPHTDAN
uniref:predicted GPI-anchored protein 58 n=1 Tax=Macaca mulatta TaxID=9544 RepID=UPI0010A29E92|nr:predicted GPI-anchored protein 58 [Macaca mulatta]XP_028696552.1 predicted GPI-anchored protein 58 [Macaca mulatta]